MNDGTFKGVLATLKRWGMDDLVQWVQAGGLSEEEQRQRLRAELTAIIFDCECLYQELGDDSVSAVDIYVDDLSSVVDALDGQS